MLHIIMLLQLYKILKIFHQCQMLMQNYIMGNMFIQHAKLWIKLNRHF